jgi:hypothetical protein
VEVPVMIALDALKAIHEFLRFQIADHHTGDTSDIAAL